MAVPFSRPCYSGPRTPGSDAKRPARRPMPQPSPVEQLLSGQLPQLGRAGLGTRLAFYALYEAWRLLQQLSGLAPQLPAVTQIRDEIHERQIEEARLEIISQEEKELGAAAAMPDVVAGSTRAMKKKEEEEEVAGAEEEDSTDAACLKSVTILEEDEPVPSHMLNDSGYASPDHSFYHVDTEAKTCSLRDFDSQQNFVHTSTPKSCKTKNNTSSSSSKSARRSILPDLVSSCHSLDSEGEEEEEGEEEDSQLLIDSCVQLASCDSWAQVGLQLCKIASAFEVTVAPPEHDGQVRLWEAYSRLKLRILRRDSRRSSSEASSGGVRLSSVCRQVLLSGAWVLMRRVL